LLPPGHNPTQLRGSLALIPFSLLRVLLVVNSFASSVTARNTVVVHRELARHHEVQVVETNRRGHATRFAQDAANRGVDVVIGYGGDGTLNEVATGIAGTDSALGVLPGGSTNVFARTLGLPNDPVGAVKLLAAALDDQTSIRPIGLGRVNGRYFCFHTGIGYDAAVVRAVEKRASVKRWLGHPLFIYAALNTWLSGYSRDEPHFSLRFDSGDGSDRADDNVVDDGYFTIVLNTNPYTYLGNRPLDLSPAATLDRGLVVVTFRTMKATAILRSLGGALAGGGVKGSAHLDERRDVDSFVVEHSQPFPYQLDGDYLGETTRLDFSHVPNAVRLVFPAG
jgi:diacylglycerol kinase family enzyme